MKKTNYKITLLFVLMLFGISSINAQNRISISLDELKMSEKGIPNYYTDLVSKQIPFIISGYLRNYNYRIFWTQQLIQEGIRDDYSKTRQKVQRDDLSALFNNRGVQFALSGEFVYWSETDFDIRIHVYQLENGKPIDDGMHYSESIYSISELHTKLSSLTALIHKDIQSILQSGPQTRIAVMCYRVASDPDVLIDEYYISDLSRTLFFDLKDAGLSNMEVIDWSESSQFCDEEDLHKTAKRLHADILLRGQILVLDDEQVKLLPVLYFDKIKRNVALPFVFTDVYDLFNSYYTSYFIQSLFKEVVNEDGSIDYNMLDYFLDGTEANREAVLAGYMESGQLDLAAISAANILRDTPSNEPVRNDFLDILIELGMYSEAEYLVSEILKSNPDDLNAMFQRGIIYYESRDLEEAYSIFTSVEEANPNFPAINYAMGITQIELGNFDDAIVKLEKQLEIQEVEQAHYFLAYAYYSKAMATNKLDDRLLILDNVLNIMDERIDVVNEDDPLYYNQINLYIDVLREYGNINYEQKKYSESAMIFQTLADYDPDKYYLDMLRFNYSYLEEYGNVNEAIKTGIELSIYTDSVYFIHAAFLRGERDENGSYYPLMIAKSIDYLDMYLQTHKNHPIALRYKGSSFFRLNQLNDAVAMYQKSYEYEKDTLQQYKILLDIAEVDILIGGEDMYKDAIKSMDQIPINSWVKSRSGQYSARDLNSILCLKLYLKVCSNYLLDAPYSADLEMLEEFIKNETIKGWSYRTFMNWLTNGNHDLSNSEKKFLTNLTKKMELRTRSF